MSICIVVLGGHRCGTSAVAGVLHHLGVFMGHKLIGATRYNRRGHFEDVEFVDFHKKIVGNWHNPCVDFAPFAGEYSALVKKRMREHALWGFKDPRFCFVFPHFLRIVDNNKIKVVNVRRNLKASAKSMAYRKGKKGSSINVSYRRALAIARRYRDAQKLALGVWKGPLLSVQYETLVTRPGKIVPAIADFVGVKPAQDAIDFISPKLKHF